MARVIGRKSMEVDRSHGVDWIPLKTIHLGYEVEDSWGSIQFSIPDDFDEIRFEITNYMPNPTSDVYADLGFQINAVGNHGYNVTQIMSTLMYQHQSEDSHGNNSAISNDSYWDQSATTNEVWFAKYCAEADNNTHNRMGISSGAGYFYLYTPHDTTRWKIWRSYFSKASTNGNQQQYQWYTGYIKTTSAINQIKFGSSNGTISSADITMYGLSK